MKVSYLDCNSFVIQMWAQFWGTANINLPPIALCAPKISARNCAVISQRERMSCWLDCHQCFSVLRYFLWGFSPWLVGAGPYFTVEAEQGCRCNWARSATFITFVILTRITVWVQEAGHFHSSPPIKHLRLPTHTHRGCSPDTWQLPPLSLLLTLRTQGKQMSCQHLRNNSRGPTHSRSKRQTTLC